MLLPVSASAGTCICPTNLEPKACLLPLQSQRLCWLQQLLLLLLHLSEIEAWHRIQNALMNKKLEPKACLLPLLLLRWLQQLLLLLLLHLSEIEAWH